MPDRSAQLTAALFCAAIAWSLPLVTAAAPGSSAGQVKPPLAELPDPDLASVEAAVADQLRQLRSSLVEALSQADAPPARTAELFGELGRHYHAYRLDAAAEACYEVAERLTPGEQRWPYYRGLLAEQQGRLDSAVGHLARALAINPEYVAGLARLAEVYRQLGRTDESALLFSIALRVSPSSPAAMAGLGELALAAGRFDDAITHLTAALEQQPGANRLRQPLAMAYRGRGDLDAARQQLELRGTVGVRPPDPLLDEIDGARTGERAHILRGRMAYGAGRFQEAAELFLKAFEAQPESTTALVNLSAALAQLGQTDNAIGALRRAVEIDSDNATAHYNLGQLLIAKNQLPAAVDELSQAASRLPEDAAVQLTLAQLLRRVGRTEEAIPYYTMAARLDPSSEETWLAGAESLFELGRWEQARAVLEQGYALLPAAHRLQAGLARLLAACPDARLRDGGRALELALQAYQTVPNAGRAETVALALGELDRCKEAAAWQKTAIGAAKSVGDEARAGALSQQLVTYDSGSPCRPPAAPAPPPSELPPQP